MEGLDNKELKCLLIIFEKIRIEYEVYFLIFRNYKKLLTKNNKNKK